MFGDLHTHPFYKPFWRRVVIVATTALWVAFELIYSQSPFWSVLAVATFLFCVWNFLITYPKNN